MKRIKTAPEELLRGREPRLGRLRGYEPGSPRWQKDINTVEGMEMWTSMEPMIDIRHKGTFSLSKVRLDQFNHQPVGWEEREIEGIPGWNLKELFHD
jgi:hypothetical protein